MVVATLRPQGVELGHLKVGVSWLLWFDVLFRGAPLQCGRLYESLLTLKLPRSRNKRPKTRKTPPKHKKKQNSAFPQSSSEFTGIQGGDEDSMQLALRHKIATYEKLL